jgi:polyhydroxybutyrate depolymerase
MRYRVHAGAAGIAGVAVALVATAHLLSTPARADATRTEWRIDTRDGPRRAIVVPARPEPTPTVIMLHGAVNTAGWAAWRVGVAEAAAARSFAAVFPQSIGPTWNDGRSRAAARADDMGFLRRLVVDLIEQGVARPDRIYVAGISNGGMMALRMVCDAADLLAGAGTVLANMPAETGADCHPARPVPVVMFNGTADQTVPYAGGGVSPLNQGGVVWGAERTAEFLADANRCSHEPEATDRLLGRTSVTRIAWTGCGRNATVTLYRVNGGGHTVLGRRRILSGQARHELSAAETIIATFAGE